MSVNPNDIAKLMQNLNSNAAKSTSDRKSSFQFPRRPDNHETSEDDDDEDDYDDDEEIDDDDVLEDDDVSDENEVSEYETNTEEKCERSSENPPPRRKVANLTSDLDFHSGNPTGLKENESLNNISVEENQQKRSVTIQEGANKTDDYENFELDEDIDRKYQSKCIHKRNISPLSLH